MTSKFIITVYLSDGEIWETVRHTLEGMNNFCKDLFSDEKVVRYTVEETTKVWNGEIA